MVQALPARGSDSPELCWRQEHAAPPGQQGDKRKDVRVAASVRGHCCPQTRAGMSRCPVHAAIPPGTQTASVAALYLRWENHSLSLQHLLWMKPRPRSRACSRLASFLVQAERQLSKGWAGTHLKPSHCPVLENRHPEPISLL